MALELEDFELLGHMSEGDLIAIESNTIWKLKIQVMEQRENGQVNGICQAGWVHWRMYRKWNSVV